jgi:heavy metal sensor kinase
VLINTRSVRFRSAVLYAGLLASILLFFATAIYFGLKRYLDSNLQRTLIERSRSIGTELPGLSTKGPEWFASETVESYQPELNGYFIRISRVEGGIVYVSGPPKDHSFEPSQIPLPTRLEGDSFSTNVEMAHRPRVLIEGIVFSNSDGSRFLVESGASYRQIDQVLDALLWMFGTLIPFIVSVIAVAGYWLMRKALRPVDEITKTARTMTSTNLSERLPLISTGDEIERLSNALNEMITRLDAAFQNIARFTADASHELRTPLTILQLELEGIVQHPELAPQLVDQIESALEEAHRLSRIVENLLVISRLDAGAIAIEKLPLNLSELVASTVEPMQLLAEEKPVLLHCDVSPNVYVKGDQSHLKQLILNLVDNAIKYTPASGQVTIRVTSDDHFAVLEVIDTGVGITSEALPRIFERFYRADKARSRNSGGAGLGLAIVRAICDAHQGEIKILSTDGLGTHFFVKLPLVAIVEIEKPTTTARYIHAVNSKQVETQGKYL